MDYRGKSALILGLGVSGKSCVRFLLKKNVALVGVDKNKSQLQNDPLFQNVTLYDETQICSLDSIDFVVKSPGITWEHPILIAAKKQNIPITGDIELGLQDLQEKGKTLFAITGSNGKTTTTMLTEHVLKAAQKKAIAVGNIGVPLLDQIDSDATIFVLELSSYQLETMQCPVFDAGAILNITPNHLDRYPSFLEYAKAKFHLQHCLKENGKLFVSLQVYDQFFMLIDPILKEKIATICPLSYRGNGILEHDLENCAAAFQLCRQVGLSEEEFWQGFLSFQKPPHRIEFVREIEGVKYINDSKSTSSEAVFTAVKSLKKEIILIAGGQGKGEGYERWREELLGKVKRVLLIGVSAPLIYEQLHGVIEVDIVNTLEKALRKASCLAKEGDVVLFSPGCASFDQFRGYEHRGEAFKQLVQQL